MRKIIIMLPFLIAAKLAIAQKVMPLYSDSIPNSKPVANREVTERKDQTIIISKISIPTLTAFLPPAGKANGTAVVICPGGGYWVVAFGHEGVDVAKEFNKMGVAAFVLKYRIPSGESMKTPEIGPLQDAQQAIKTIREHAAEWNINPNKVGIMGFSAGGHLASTAGTHFTNVVIPNLNNTSVRPDFMVLVYPVISFTDSIGHIGSRDQLIGKQPTPKKIIEYSNELQVTKATPPTFLVHAADDNGVKPQNSIGFYLALLQNNVPAELHIYQTGGHGFGLHLPNAREFWMERCKNWLELNGWLKK